MNKLLVVFIGVLLGSGSLAHAQTLTPGQAGSPDSVVQVAADACGLPLMAPGQAPFVGTFWWVMPVGNAVPMPFPPADSSVPIYQIADGQFLVDETSGQVAVSPHRLGVSPPVPGGSVAAAVSNQATALVNLIGQIQAKAASQQSRMLMRSFGLDVPTPGGGDGGDGSDGDYPISSSTYTIDTNQLWLQITNVANGLAGLNLYNATNQVYAIWTTTNLLGDWQVQTELWPTLDQTNVFPFTLPTGGQPTLFVRAEDWTGVTENGNNVPDWWLWNYFGTTALTDTNQDAAGNLLTDDYTSQVAPMVFKFTGIEVANNYVNSSSIPAQLTVTGNPYYVAMLVDDSNFADAVWNPYANSNLTVNLGLTEGWHEVWIGLRGHADDASAAIWQWTRLKLDFTTPQLVITNPAGALVDQPVIQLQGYCSKALHSITYDLSNAAGTATNQLVLVEGQHYSTNTWEFTTNYFQAYDVPLTNGVNVITLHATDLAGNSTTTNFSFTVDYSSKTNPPTLNLLWPQAGMEIIGSNIVCRGWVGDATAKVTVQLLDANGNTNTAGALVGRDGNFYAGNLTLATGTNYLTYTVVDVAGNYATSNITVTTSDLGLTMNPVVAGQSLVTGTIDDSSYTVYVNGVQATNDGLGNWSATITPIGIGGGAVVVNAVNGGDPTLQQLVDPPQGVFLSDYSFKDHKVGRWEEGTECMSWNDGGGGSWNYEHTVLGDTSPNDSDSESFPPTPWPLAWPDDVWWCAGQTFLPGTAGEGMSPNSGEHGQWQYQDKYFLYCHTEDTAHKLATGGPLGSTQQNLWVLSATAVDDETYLPIPPEQITIGKLGNIDTNGNLYVLLPDNDPTDVTPTVLGFASYSFILSATKHPLAISANGIGLSNNAVAPGANFCVGQKINFDVVGLPSRIYDLTAIWTLPGTFVNTNSDPNCNLFYEENAALLRPPLKQSATHCWYVKDGQPLTASVQIYYRCSENGKLFDQTITGQFNVHRPTTGNGSPYQPDGTPTVMVVGNFLTLGDGRYRDMSFQHTITTDAYCAGQAGYVQVLDGDYTDPKNNTCVPVPVNGPALDGALGKFPADRQTAVPANSSSSLLNPFYDGPYVAMWNDCASEDLNFKTYLMFQPPGGIWVPLRKITWELRDEAANSTTVNGAEHVIGPVDNETTEFPEWLRTFP